MNKAEHTCQAYASRMTQISSSDPLFSRYGKSALLGQSSGPAGLDTIEIGNQEVYGNPEHPICFRIGNGGAGYTGVLRALCEQYIHTHGDDFRIGWVSNHSRHSQLALLADVVQLALTYEPENEDIAVDEGWAVRICRAFNDHFILVGPNVAIDSSSIEAALRDIAGRRGEREIGTDRPLLFHTRGDGSATFGRETLLWKAAGVHVGGAEWIMTYALTPYQALLRAEEDEAFLITDRATFLTAQKDGKISSLRCHREGGVELLNPCAALVGSDDRADASHIAAAAFAQWLSGPIAQDLIRNFGKYWTLKKPLFTIAAQQDFDEQDRLSTST